MNTIKNLGSTGIYAYTTLISVFICAPGVLYFEPGVFEAIKVQVATQGASSFYGTLLSVGLLYHLYNQFAFNTLGRVSPVSHGECNVVKRVAIIATSVLFFAVGTALYVFYRVHPELLSPTVQTDATFSWFIAQQLPMGVSGLVVSGVFAAAMSTLSSSINSITTAIVTDFSVRLRPQAGEARHMQLARRLTVVVGAAGTMSALLLATWDIRSIWDMFLQAVGLFGGGLAGIFALGIFTRRAHGAGAITGFVSSAVVLVLVQRPTPLHFLLYAGIGVGSAFALGYVASLVLPSRGRPIDGLTVYDRVTSGPPARQDSADARAARTIRGEEVR
jgi:Na+/proline symporter